MSRRRFVHKFSSDGQWPLTSLHIVEIRTRILSTALLPNTLPLMWKLQVLFRQETYGESNQDISCK